MSSSNLIAGVEAWLAEREAIEAAATAGPWRRLHDGGLVPVDPLGTIGKDKSEVAMRESTCQCGQVWSEPGDWPVAFCDTWLDGEGFTVEQQMHNAKFIADARTLAPGTIAYGKQLVKALREAEAEQAAGNWDEIHVGAVNTLRAQLAAFAEAHQLTAAQLAATGGQDGE